MLSEYDYKIFTMTVSCIFKDCIFNIINIGKYLDIDSDILGIKYNYGKTSILKGNYITAMYKKLKVKNSDKINKVLFFNQVSLSIKINENIVNAKLFLNGSLHLTGIKNSNEPKLVIELLYNKLLNLKNKNDIVLLCNDTNGVLVDNNNMIYSNCENKSIIGYVLDESTYIIDKKSYKIDFYTGYFISDTIESKRTRQILDFSGNVIGYTKIELMKNKLKLYKNNVNIHFDNHIYIDIEERPYCLIYYDNVNFSSIIGKIVYNCKKPIENKKQNIIEYNYNCNPFKIQSQELKYNIDINCINVYFNIQVELNKNRLFQRLLQDNYICQLKSGKFDYAGLKFIYKKSLNKQKIKGICECTKKCTCSNITFGIFQSGNVNVFGFKNESDIKEIINDFHKIINKNIDYIKKRNF